MSDQAVRKMDERWWIPVCPQCNGLVLTGQGLAHNETCPNRMGWAFIPTLVEVVPSGSSDTLIDRILRLIGDVAKAREHRTSANDPIAARNLSLAITHLEDAALRIGPPEWTARLYTSKANG